MQMRYASTCRKNQNITTATEDVLRPKIRQTSLQRRVILSVVQARVRCD